MDLNNISMLAEDDGSIVEVIFMVVVAVIGIFGSLASKAKQKKAEEARRRIITEKLRQQQAEEQDGGWEVVPPTSDQPRPMVVEAPPVRTTSSNAPPVKKKTLQELMKPKKRSLVSAEVGQPHVVDDKVKHPQVGSAKMEQKSKLGSKITSRRSLQGGTPGVPATKPAPPAIQPTVKLGNARTLRQAMIFHEILSQPKALRQEDSLWDSPY